MTIINGCGCIIFTVPQIEHGIFRARRFFQHTAVEEYRTLQRNYIRWTF